MKIDYIVDDLIQHKTKKYRQRALLLVDTIVLHHTATSPTTTIEAIARYHVNVKKWPGIAYHYCITKDGGIFQTNNLETVSYHVYNHNKHTIGICLIGNFTDVYPTGKQLSATRYVTAYLNEQFGKLKFMPHREFNQTACPGATWTEWFNLIGIPESPTEVDWQRRAIIVEKKLELLREIIDRLNNSLSVDIFS